MQRFIGHRHHISVNTRVIISATDLGRLRALTGDYRGAEGALIWLPDLSAWAREAARLLRPAGHLFIYEAHPAVALWSWDADRPRIRDGRLPNPFALLARRVR
jgi:hypothetical protein